ncbi:MAG: transporter substrate-binding domain-containing protein, partial [Gracilibacteraceae bacterium]|nr:transporter substrate-binding domain-containing protein [Gracilibacteraceae bacterium]
MNLSCIKKCVWAALFFALLLTGAGCAPVNPAAGDDAPVVYTDFRDIPGVTAEEIQAIEALAAKYQDSGFSYGTFPSTESFTAPDGTVGGFSALFCDWMSQLFGVRFTPATYDWDALYNGLLNGQIDFSGEITATPERRGLFNMTRPFVQRAIVAYRRNGALRLEEIAQARPLRFGFLTGSNTAGLILASSPYDITPIYRDTLEDGIVLLNSGEADAFLAEEHGEANMPDGWHIEKIFPI